MPAVSKAQQKFFGIVRAIQKGEMAPTTPETAKAAASMKKKDVKDFASTKHKNLPDKKIEKEEVNYSQRDKIMKKAKPLHKHLFKNFNKGDRKGDVNESRYDRYDNEKKEFEKSDSRMKHGKNWKQYVKDAQSAKNKLRPGEVRKFNRETGKWESNKN